MLRCDFSTRLINELACIFTPGRKDVDLLMDITKLIADVAAEKGAVDSAVVLLNGLGAEIRANAGNQVALDALATELEAQTANLSAAVAANPDPEVGTPPVPSPAP